MADHMLDQLCINTIRFLAIDSVEQASSGHPGTPMGAATMAMFCGTGSLGTVPKTPPGPTGTGSSSRQDTLQLCCIP